MNTNNKKLIFLAILIALNVAISKILLIPTPGGFITVMDGLVFTAASLFGKRGGYRWRTERVFTRYREWLSTMDVIFASHSRYTRLPIR